MKCVLQCRTVYTEPAPQNHPVFCTLPWMKFEQCLFLVEHKSHNFCHVPSIQYDFVFMNGIQFSRWDFPPKLCKFQVWFWSRERLVFGFKMLRIWNTSSLSKTLLRCTPPDVEFLWCNISWKKIFIPKEKGVAYYALALITGREYHKYHGYDEHTNKSTIILHKYIC